MPARASQPTWDIFCSVVDNFGDIGVCWRLARQLTAEHGRTVRLWVDELAAFRQLCPEVDVQAVSQQVFGVEVRHWRGDLAGVAPGSVVVEAFACHLPERFVEAMAACDAPPVWINLDYLSAEAWVSGCHTLPSPHPRLPLTKYFFFPGFDETTGGLLRERELAEQRQAFCAAPEARADFWRQLGQGAPEPGTLTVSLFAYENRALADLLEIWAQSPSPVCCLAPVTRTLPAIAAFAGRELSAGDTVRRGALEIRLLPFVSQPDYDRLLWSCDLNMVRGEDSFVRAQLAAKPLLWHIYPQADAAHQVKLAAFVERYCAALPADAASVLRELMRRWNGGTEDQRITPELWEKWRSALPVFARHAEIWENYLKKQEDLCSSLVRFCRSKL